MRRDATASPRSNVIQFRPRATLSQGFTWLDRQVLAELGETWSVSFSQSDTGPFATLYRDSATWASLGVVRQGDAVLVWNAVTLRDIGRFATMLDAASAIEERPDAATPVSTVVPFQLASAS